MSLRHEFHMNNSMSIQENTKHPTPACRWISWGLAKTCASIAVIIIGFLAYNNEPMSHHTNVSLLHTADNLWEISALSTTVATKNLIIILCYCRRSTPVVYFFIIMTSQHDVIDKNTVSDVHKWWYDILIISVFNIHFVGLLNKKYSPGTYWTPLVFYWWLLDVVWRTLWTPKYHRKWWKRCTPAVIHTCGKF